MTSVLSSMRSLMGMFDDKVQEFVDEINNVHNVWLEEIQQEANHMFSRDFNTEPELMPKTPSQKRNTRRKRVSLSRQEANQTRRFSKGKRSNLRGSAVQTLNLIAEDEVIPKASTSNTSSTTRPKRATRKNKQTQLEVAHDESQASSVGSKTEPERVEEEEVDKSSKVNDAEVTPDGTCSTEPSPPQIPTPELVVSISKEERLSAEFAGRLEASPGRTATKIAIADSRKSSRRSSVRHSLKLRHSLAGLRHSMTQESVRRASRRSMLKKKSARINNSKSSSTVDGESSIDTVDEEEDVLEIVDADVPEKSEKTSEPQIIGVDAAVERITRSVAANSPKLAPFSLFTSQPNVSIPVKNRVVEEIQQTSQEVRRSSRNTKRKTPDTVEDSPSKRFSPPKKSHSAIKPNMKSFLHTVQKNQMLMMTPNSFGRTPVIKSFIKHTTPLKVDPKTKERHKLEALRKKQEQEEERMRKMEEDKKRKQEELRRKRDERIKRVFEAKVKEEQKEEEKKKKIELKMAQIEEKNDKRQAEERTKKRLALKKQEELEQKRKLEEEAKKKKIQQAEEEKRQQELAAKKKAEEEEQQARKELEQERERERRAAAERSQEERLEKEKALALQHALERAAREKEMMVLEEKRKVLEEKRKLEEQQRLAAKEKALKEREEANKRGAAAKQEKLNVTVDLERSVMSTPIGKAGPGLNVTVDIEPSSPQSYVITPKGVNKPLIISKNADDYGMDLNSDDSTDDESAPRKPIPSWAEGSKLKQIIMKQYFNPPNLHSLFGAIEPPKLENIFYKSKPRYFKRTSSAVWHSPPGAK